MYVEEKKLKRFFLLRARGYTNSQIAREMGVHRSTIQRWIRELQSMSYNQFMRLYWDTMTGGTYDLIGNVPANRDVHG